ncbi:hypothetical protein JKP88DRAFT_290373 [Tribonema minus]|uniref:Uncharacterized protein n=1 Tax=Tribonema minus TaxID=303371 RepID=A0A836CF27_9STRA|nr:hypothetical protein JKP88DRAFT_290373 [Tribonema minus]
MPSLFRVLTRPQAITSEHGAAALVALREMIEAPATQFLAVLGLPDALLAQLPATDVGALLQAACTAAEHGALPLLQGSDAPSILKARLHFHLLLLGWVAAVQRCGGALKRGRTRRSSSALARALSELVLRDVKASPAAALPGAVNGRSCSRDGGSGRAPVDAARCAGTGGGISCCHPPEMPTAADVDSDVRAAAGTAFGRPATAAGAAAVSCVSAHAQRSRPLYRCDAAAPAAGHVLGRGAAGLPSARSAATDADAAPAATIWADVRVRHAGSAAAASARSGGKAMAEGLAAAPTAAAAAAAAGAATAAQATTAAAEAVARADKAAAAVAAADSPTSPSPSALAPTAPLAATFAGRACRRGTQTLRAAALYFDQAPPAPQPQRRASTAGGRDAGLCAGPACRTGVAAAACALSAAHALQTDKRATQHTAAPDRISAAVKATAGTPRRRSADDQRAAAHGGAAAAAAAAAAGRPRPRRPSSAAAAATAAAAAAASWRASSRRRRHQSAAAATAGFSLAHEDLSGTQTDCCSSCDGCGDGIRGGGSGDGGGGGSGGCSSDGDASGSSAHHVSTCELDDEGDMELARVRAVLGRLTHGADAAHRGGSGGGGSSSGGSAREAWTQRLRLRLGLPPVAPGAADGGAAPPPHPLPQPLPQQRSPSYGADHCLNAAADAAVPVTQEAG